MTTTDQLAAFLARLPQVTRVETAYVTIGREQYPAARYSERLQHMPGTPAYARGEREYTRTMIYCIGDLPSAKRRGNVAYRIIVQGDMVTHAEDNTDWYVAGYYPAYVGRGPQERAEPNEYHPFGNSFMLAPWDVKDSTIDQYERVPYRRMPCTVCRAGWTLRAHEKESAAA